MIETDVKLDELSRGDLLQDTQGAQVFMRMARQPSAQWLECFSEVLKLSPNGLFGNHPPEYQNQGRPRIRVLVGPSGALAKVNAVREAVTKANQVADERNQQEDAKAKAAQETAARQKGIFDAIEKELLGN
jgi:predicted PhzF superfamily epimerase YddE/YHI9